MRDVDADILGLIRQGAVTPDEVAKRLGISWATANGHLLKLVGEGKLVHLRKDGVNVYQRRRSSTQTFHVPKRIGPKPLEQLSDELARYFPRDLTATEMIEKERRKA
jgi:predicted ArsR family transcriptional regulator